MSEDKHTCSTCMYLVADTDPDPRFARHRCHRYPKIWNPEHGGYSQFGKLRGEYEHVIVETQDWCGEWKEKQ